MKIDKTIILEEPDFYEAIKNYLEEKLNIPREHICSIAYRASSAGSTQPTMSVIIQQQDIKILKQASIEEIMRDVK